MPSWRGPIEGRFSRRHFLAAAVAAAGLDAGALIGAAGASGARTGPWCVPLTKLALDNVFDFSLALLEPDGGVFTLSELKGKPVWLQFFASWCGPCHAEAPDIVRIVGTYGDAIHAVGIDVGESPDRAQGFRDLHKLPFPIALDSTRSVFKGFGLRGLPTHIFLDSESRISCVSVGDLTPDQMDNEIAVALERASATPKPAG